MRGKTKLHETGKKGSPTAGCGRRAFSGGIFLPRAFADLQTSLEGPLIERQQLRLLAELVLDRVPHDVFGDDLRIADVGAEHDDVQDLGVAHFQSHLRDGNLHNLDVGAGDLALDDGAVDEQRTAGDELMRRPPSRRTAAAPRHRFSFHFALCELPSYELSLCWGQLP